MTPTSSYKIEAVVTCKQLVASSCNSCKQSAATPNIMGVQQERRTSPILSGHQECRTCNSPNFDGFASAVQNVLPTLPPVPPARALHASKCVCLRHRSCYHHRQRRHACSLDVGRSRSIACAHSAARRKCRKGLCADRTHVRCIRNQSHTGAKNVCIRSYQLHGRTGLRFLR